MKKKLLSALLCVAMVASLVVGCGAKEEAPAADAPAATEEAAAPAAEADTMEGTHVFMFKSTGNSFGDLMYEGFAEYMAAKGEKTAYTSPAETTVAAQVQMLDELITQKVASINLYKR